MFGGLFGNPRPRKPARRKRYANATRDAAGKARYPAAIAYLFEADKLSERVERHLGAMDTSSPFGRDLVKLVLKVQAGAEAARQEGRTARRR